MARLRPKLAQVPGARLFLLPVQDIRVGGRQSNAAYQFTLQADDQPDALSMGAAPDRGDAAIAGSDGRQFRSAAEGASRPFCVIDRATAMRLGVTMSAIDNTLYDAFGQRQVSVIYNPLNQYHVVMEVAPRYWQNPDTLKEHMGQHGGSRPVGHASAPTRRPARYVELIARQPSTAPAAASSSARNLGDQFDRGDRPWQRFRRRFGQHQRGDHGAARRIQPLRTRLYAARRQSSGPVRRLDDFLQSGAGKVVERCRNRDPPGDGRHRHAGEHPRQFRRHGGEPISSRCRPSRF